MDPDPDGDFDASPQRRQRLRSPNMMAALMAQRHNQDLEHVLRGGQEPPPPDRPVEMTRMDLSGHMPPPPPRTIATQEAYGAPQPPIEITRPVPPSLEVGKGFSIAPNLLGGSGDLRRALLQHDPRY